MKGNTVMLKKKMIVIGLCIILIMANIITADAATITASDHNILPIRYISAGILQSGAEGYTVASIYHRTSVVYYVCWQQEAIVRKWGYNKVYATTGYVNKFSNLKSAFASEVYYYYDGL